MIECGCAWAALLPLVRSLKVCVRTCVVWGAACSVVTDMDGRRPRAAPRAPPLPPRAPRTPPLLPATFPPRKPLPNTTVEATGGLPLCALLDEIRSRLVVARTSRTPPCKNPPPSPDAPLNARDSGGEAVVPAPRCVDHDRALCRQSERMGGRETQPRSPSPSTPPLPLTPTHTHSLVHTPQHTVYLSCR